jgi:hypothetical protein
MSADFSFDFKQRRWWQPVPLDYTEAEMLCMRLLFSILVYYSIKWETRTLVEQKFPHGLAHIIDFTWLAQHPPANGWKLLCAAGMLPYILGRGAVIGLLPMLLSALAIGTLVTSQSQNVNHSWQLVTMMLCAHWLMYALTPFLAKLRKLSPLQVHRYAIYAGMVVFAASYVVCGVTKLLSTGGTWVWKTPLLSIQLLKTNWAQHYDSLEALPSWLNSATEWIVHYPNAARLFFGSGLIIELLGFVVLISHRWARWGGLAIIALHLSISLIMQLDFTYHIVAALIFCVNLPGWWMRRSSPMPVR